MIRRLSLVVMLVLTLAINLAAQQRVFPALDSEGRALYQVSITAADATITGLCVFKCEGDTIRATLLNEFGVRAFSFWLSPDRRKLKLRDVMPALNKWYIKRVISGDLKWLCNATTADLGIERKHRRIDPTGQGGVVLTNSRRHITYQFDPAQPSDHATD